MNLLSYDEILRALLIGILALTGGLAGFLFAWYAAKDYIVYLMRVNDAQRAFIESFKRGSDNSSEQRSD